METISDEKTTILQVLNVAAALIENQGKYLLVKRAPHKENGGMWEFPGGKINDSESLNACVEREILEELGIPAKASKLLASSETQVGSKIIRLFGISATIEREPQILKDHTEFRWAPYDELSTCPLTLPDLALLHNMQTVTARDVEFYHVHPSSIAKFYALFNGVIGVFFGFFIIFSPGPMSRFPMSWALKGVVGLMTPFFYAFLGGMIGALVALIYNGIAYMIGGVKIKLRS